jgi:hypothetical protein
MGRGRWGGGEGVGRLKNEDGPRDSAKSARLEAASTKTAPLPFQHSKVGARKKPASKCCRILVRERGKKASAKFIRRIRLNFFFHCFAIFRVQRMPHVK